MNNTAYKIAWFFVIVVLLVGLFLIPLFGFDAPEYANIAAHMYFKNDWINIMNHNDQTGQIYDYLDKPHMLFWSAMLGFKLFGVHDWTYRLFSVLLSFAGCYATFRLGKMLYNINVGKVASLIYITAQAIILANHDVKTDTLLTNFVVLGAWQLVDFVHREKLSKVILGAAFLALGVGTKGMIAVLVAGCVLFFYLLGLRKWKMFYNWKWIIGVVAFFIALSPFLYFYYLQFDLHPEKYVNGGTGRSGIKFLLWSQSFERFAGERNFVMGSEFSFFFHSFIWAFLPWSIIAYIASFSRLAELFRTRFQSFFTREQLTFTGTWAMFIIMSFSKFKLPHYINVLFPFFAIFTAAYLFQLANEGKQKALRSLLIVQYVIIAIAILFLIALNYWAFPVTNLAITIIGLAGLMFLVYEIFKRKFSTVDKIWYYSALAILIFNFFMNANFYPKIAQYNGGYVAAKEMKEKNIDAASLYRYDYMMRSFEWQIQKWRPILHKEDVMQKVQNGDSVIVFTNKRKKDELQQFFSVQPIISSPEYAISGLSLDFINPKTRPQTLDSVFVLKVSKM